MPRTSHSIFTTRAMAPVLARTVAFCLGCSSRISRSCDRCALNFMMPACSCTSPLLSGAESTVPCCPRVRISTRSPGLTVLGGRVLSTFFVSPSERLSTPCSMRLRMALVWASGEFISFFMRLRSAMMLSDSRRVCSIRRRASSRALRMVVSRFSSISLRSFSASSRRRMVSALAWAAISRSRSATWRWYSALAITSSKRMFSPEISSFAASIRFSGRPSLRLISKAFDLPGTPMDSR